MKIIKFTAENFKRLKSVEIIPQNNTVVISGANGQGKSSVLDSIWLALGGAAAAKETKTERPIRDGADNAKTVLDFGEFEVARNWTSNEKSYLKVKANGKSITSPQELLDKMMGKLSFDPLAFALMEGKEQLKAFQELVDLPFDPKELDKEKKDIYDQRTVVNREVKQLEGELAGLDRPQENLPEKELEMDKVLADIEIAQNGLRENEAKRNKLQQLRTDCRQAADNVARLKAELEEAQRQFELIVQQGIKLGAEVEALEDPDVEKYTKSLRQIDETNRAIRNAAKYREIERKIAAKRTDSKRLTDQLKAIDQKKEQAIKDAKMPIDGLGLTEEGITYQGVPFGQCSSAEKLKVSVAMAMAKNPTIRVIRISQGSLLDSQSFKIIEEMAEKEDFQVWIEVVDEQGDVGICIEDGQIKSIA